jgi:hypothetical protein
MFIFVMVFGAKTHAKNWGDYWFLFGGLHPPLLRLSPAGAGDLFITRYDFRTIGSRGLFKKSDDFSSNWD